MANFGNGESRNQQQSQSSSSISSTFDVFQSQKNEIINQSQKSNFDTNTNNNPRKRRKKPTSKPTTITTTTEDTIFQLILNQIETKKPKNNFKSRTSTKSSDDLPSMTSSITNHFTPKSTIFSKKSTIIEEFVVTENILNLNNLVESIDVKSGSNNDNDNKTSATFRQASFFPSNKNNPSNLLRLNWILMIILITASLIIH